MPQSSITLNDGNAIPQLGLGVWKAEDGEQVEKAVSTAIGAGYRSIDTAMVYRNEDGVGRAIKSSGVDRSELFVTTKLWNSDQGEGKVRPALEASLERLGIDYIDMYLIHWPMPAKKLYLETWREFERLKTDSLVRSIGVSNFGIEQLEDIRQAGLSTPVVNQVELHPGFNQAELREYTDANNIAIESWSPLGQGGDLLKNETILRIANAHTKTAAQVIIKWHLQNGLIVIPKSVTPNRIVQNFNVFDFELTADDMSAIDSMEPSGRLGPDPATMNIS